MNKNTKKTVLFGFSTLLLIAFVFSFQYIGIFPWLLIPVIQKFEGPFKTNQLMDLDSCGTIKEETFGQGISSERIEIAVWDGKKKRRVIGKYSTNGQMGFDLFAESIKDTVRILYPEWGEWAEKENLNICNMTIVFEAIDSEEYLIRKK